MEEQMKQVEEQSSGSSSSPNSALEDCIKLLKGSTDEQRLAGLLVATKFIKNDDQSALLRVYNAIGHPFLDRLLKTGMGKGGTNGSCENQDSYLKLSISILSAFCRVAEIASSRDMVTMIPLLVEILSNVSDLTLIEEGIEFLFLVSAAHEDGVRILYESGGMNMLASKMPTLPDGSHVVELSMKLLQLIMSKLSLDIINNQYSSELAMVVVTVAKQFALSQNALKFEALHLLSAILSSSYSTPIHEALHSYANDTWSTYVRVGVVAILQNRVAPEQRLEALIVAESVISIIGEKWLIGQMSLADPKDPIPVDRCIVLVLESSRVEIAVLLNDLAYMKYEKSGDFPSDGETILLKQRNLGIAFSLVEKIIKLISSFGEDESFIAIERIFTKIISGLNESIGVVLEYLKDAKDHGQHKGNDLLASVRIIGSYLAEMPSACSEKVQELLEYMVSVEGADERSPHSSVCFLLPMLCQITMEIDGCKVLASSGAYKAVVECLIKLISEDGGTIEDNGPIFLACDTIMNLLLKRDQIEVPLDGSYAFRLLGALSSWAEQTGDCSNIMMASSICSLILDSTSEAALLRHPHFNSGTLTKISQLISRSLAICGQGKMSEEAKDVADLHEIIISGYFCWANRFPRIKEVVDRQMGFQLQP